MEDDLRQIIASWLEPRVDAFGMAPTERFEEAPDEHHPSLLCRDASTVIVYCKALPQALLTSPANNMHLLHCSHHTAYSLLDEVGLELANLVSSNGYAAVPVPSYAPLIFRDLVPWGVLSLKHAAVRAGLGAFGRGGVVLHPRYGSMLRFGAVVTAARLPADPLLDEDPCPPKCNACHEACPVEALAEKSFQKMACLGHSIKHSFYGFALRDEEGLKNIEMIINTAGYNYWLDCNECIKVCPRNRKPKSKT